MPVNYKMDFGNSAVSKTNLSPHGNSDTWKLECLPKQAQLVEGNFPTPENEVRRSLKLEIQSLKEQVAYLKGRQMVGEYKLIVLREMLTTHFGLQPTTIQEVNSKPLRKESVPQKIIELSQYWINHQQHHGKGYE